MAHIDYFMSTMSPNCYLATDELEVMAEKYGATITYKPLDILGLFDRTGGIRPPQRHISRQEYRLQELPRKARRLGLTFNPKPAFWPVNQAPSSYAVIAAQNAGGGDLGGLCRTFLRAVWAEEKDISDDAVVRAALEANGFDPGLADSGMLAGAEEYAANMEEAVSRGAFGAPFYIIAETDDRFWGQDKLVELEWVLAGEPAPS